MTRFEIEFQGRKLRAVEQSGVLVVWTGRSGVVAADFLGRDLTVNGKRVTVYEALDPYSYPHVELPHTNEGMVAELRYAPKGENMPKPRLVNEPFPRRNLMKARRG